MSPVSRKPREELDVRKRACEGELGVQVLSETKRWSSGCGGKSAAGVRRYRPPCCHRRWVDSAGRCLRRWLMSGRRCS